MSIEPIEICESCGKREYNSNAGWMFFEDGPALCPDCHEEEQCK